MQLLQQQKAIQEQQSITQAAMLQALQLISRAVQSTPPLRPSDTGFFDSDVADEKKAKERGATPVTATKTDTKPGSRIQSSSHKAKMMLGIGLVLTPTELLCHLVTCRDETLADRQPRTLSHDVIEI
ncbi:hypothetical protein E4U17_007445 [Claviceps sp. LM77 group G4]|nr:hypothetical protein E4U17_007445 [Claviceps sp. LM77 group G4]